MEQEFRYTQKKSLLKKVVNKKTGLGIGAVAVTAMAGNAFFFAELPKRDLVYGQQIESAIQLYEDAGFTNIQKIEMPDLEYGQYFESEVVDRVVSEDTIWQEGTVFKSTPITIFYHVAKGDAKEIAISFDKKVQQIERTFKNEGFTDLELEAILLPKNGNEEKTDVVESITIGNYTYNSDYFYSSSLPVFIRYYDVSEDNKVVPKTLQLKQQKKEAEKILKDAGFNNLQFEGVEEKDLSKNGQILSITLDGIDYDFENQTELVLKNNSLVKLRFSDSSSFAKLPTIAPATKSSDVKKQLEEAGFTKIQLEKEETADISRHDTLSSITIDGQVQSDTTETVFKKESKVTIRYYSAEKAIAEEARKKEEARLAEEAKQAAVASQQASQIQQFAQAPSQSVYYKNCTAARNAGAAPVRIGDPGYAPHLDRDGDGIGCE
ncbi:TPA: excalibur calcium-binding domain-containing protein [Streptococcus suis]